MLKEFATYLEAQLGMEIGTELICGHTIPDDPDTTNVLVESGGVSDFYLLDAPAISLQILSRAKSYWTARRNAHSYYNLIHGLTGVTLQQVESGPTYYINTAQARAIPQSIGKDPRGRHIFSTNYILRIQEI